MDRKESFGKVASTIRLSVANLRDPTTLVPMLEDLGRRHLGYGVAPGHLQLFGNALIAALAEFDAAWSESTAEAWRRAYEAMSRAMLQGMKPV